MSAIYKPAVETLRRGGVVLLPTETGWCRAADATHETACAAVLAGHTDAEPPTVLLADVGLLDRYLVRVPDVAWDLIEFAEKPLTVVFSQGKNVAPNVLGDGGTLAIRVVKDRFSRGLIQAFGRSLLAVPAAKPDSGGTPAGADFVLDYPEAPRPVPATIVQLGVGGEFAFLRK